MKSIESSSLIRDICKNQPGHFNFYRKQIITCITIISIVASVVLIILYNIKFKYPLDDERVSDSYLTPLFGWQRDSHDEQWESFRQNIITLLVIMFVWKILYDRMSFFKKPSALMSFGIVFSIYSFRADFIFYFGLLGLWYLATKYFYRTNWIIPACWCFMIVALFINQKFDHLRDLSIWCHEYIPIESLKNRNAPILWTNMVNMVFLKLLSFTIDCHRGDQDKQRQKHSQKCKQKTLCYQCRDLFPLPPITFFNFCQYIFYAPTFFAGPPIAYKNFHSFKTKPTTKQPEYLRCFLLLISFQLYHHLVHTVRPNQSMSLFELWILSLFNLMFIWYKFLVIWRLTRMWSLMMGVDVIDNMGRCVLNNYGFQRFWRMWHKGFNHWLIRYLYIPCGGNRNFISVVLVIAFVAFWHDHRINIVFWAFILAIFMVPELMIKNYFRKHYLHLYPKQWFKYLCAIICSFYIQILCTCNLIGFGYSLHESSKLFEAAKQSIPELILIQCIITVAVIIQFYIREVDGRKD